ncbi:hypothetical protein [Congregicoccus parvus]|uniref:hypothetical protein n=1 Tax=Congregicoccus parvus TaxID=3081749 RepID=UPI003FA6039D
MITITVRSISPPQQLNPQTIAQGAAKTAEVRLLDSDDPRHRLEQIPEPTAHLGTDRPDQAQRPT